MKRSDFKVNSNPAYKASAKGGWLDEVCSHMVERMKPKGYWTKERCLEEALKYKTKSEFRENAINVYNNCSKGGWLNEVCSHLADRTTLGKNLWSKEQCAQEARKFKTRTDFQRESNSVYHRAMECGWLDEICSHMIKIIRSKNYKVCQEEALKYDNRNDFKKGSIREYEIALKKGWLDLICAHMDLKLQVTKISYWTKRKLSK